MVRKSVPLVSDFWYCSQNYVPTNSIWFFLIEILPYLFSVTVHWVSSVITALCDVFTNYRFFELKMFCLICRSEAMVYTRWHLVRCSGCAFLLCKLLEYFWPINPLMSRRRNIMSGPRSKLVRFILDFLFWSFLFRKWQNCPAFFT